MIDCGGVMLNYNCCINMIDNQGVLNLNWIVEINHDYYSGNEQLKKIIIGNTLKKIDSYSFYGCKNLKEIDFSNTILEEIDDSCFRYCTSLKSIHLPLSIKSIKEDVFENCTNLKYVILDGVVRIGYGSFENCINLEELTFYQDVKDNILCEITHKIKINCCEQNINYFKKIFPKSKIDYDNSYVLK